VTFTFEPTTEGRLFVVIAQKVEWLRKRVKHRDGHIINNERIAMRIFKSILMFQRLS